MYFWQAEMVGLTLSRKSISGSTALLMSVTVSMYMHTTTYKQATLMRAYVLASARTLSICGLLL